jgi:glutathione S-transferase
VLLYDNALSGNCYRVCLLFAQLGVEYQRELDRVAAQPSHVPIRSG